MCFDFMFVDVGPSGLTSRCWVNRVVPHGPNGLTLECIFVTLGRNALITHQPNGINGSGCAAASASASAFASALEYAAAAV